jgi:hypothetical protein
MWLLIPSLFVGFFGHITAVVAATVAATSGVPEASKGLASGLMTTSQRVASTIGIPALAAVMAIRPDLLSGIHIALATDVVLTVIAVAMIAAGLKQRQPAGNPSRFRIAVYRPMQVRAGSVSSCSTGVPSSGRIGQVGQDDLRKWQNATKTALPLFDGGWL